MSAQILGPHGALTGVFTYGTLLANEPNHHLLARARFIGEARTKPEFELRDLGAFPGLVRGGEQAIVGEVYEVDGQTLRALDRLEGHPSFYQRIAIELDDGRLVETYILPRDRVDGRPVIQSGSWRVRQKGTTACRSR